MKVLSLFDGISCGMVALERAGIDVERYVAYEIEPNAIKISKKNYQNIEHCGDVTTADFTQYEGFDLLIGGSPCQSLSITRGEIRTNLDGKSKLFFEYVRALKEAKPKYFLFENVSSMNDESKKIISELLGCKPIFIDSKCFSAQSRPRLYWTNISSVRTNIPESSLCLNDILESDVDESYFYNYPIINIDMSKQVCGTLDFKINEMHKRVFNPDFKVHTLTCCAGGNLQKKVMINGRARKLTPLEYERLQTLPDGYTEGVAKTHRYNSIGNGWTVDVIAHIFSYLKNKQKKEESEEKEMELKIYAPTEDAFVKAIEWNHEEIKKQVSEKVEYYKTLVYTEDQMALAKKDRATLNKFITALEDKRKEIKKQCMAPYESFEKQMKEIIAIVNEPIAMIDTQVKGYEEQKKEEKRNAINDFWETQERPEGLALQDFFDDRWLNASTSMKSIQDAITGMIEKYKQDVETLSNLPMYSFEAKQVYFKTLNLGMAMNEVNRLSDIAKKKAEYEAEMERIKELNDARKLTETASVPRPIEEKKEVAKQWIGFEALLSTDDAFALKNFFESRGIEFKPL